MNNVNDLKSKYLKMLQCMREQLENTGSKKATLYEDIAWLSQQIENYKPVIAVTGKFSAGKSRLLNFYIDGKYLPEDQSPKTAFATELYYSSSQPRLELVCDDETVIVLACNELESVEFVQTVRYARLYIDSPRLKALADIVLVDMPGFDSGVQAHQRAISNYLIKSDFFINLLSVETAFDSSINRHLEEIYYDHNKDFTCILSKAGRKTSNEIVDIKDAWLNNLSPIFPHLKEIGHVETIGMNVTMDAFENVIDTCLQRNDEFLRNRWQEALQNILRSVRGSIREELRLISTDDAELREALRQTEEQFKFLQRQLKDELDCFRYRLCSKGKEQLINEARSALHNSAGSLVLDVKNNTLNIAITEILRPLLQSRLNNLVDKAMHDLQFKLNQLEVLPGEVFSINLQIPPQEKSEVSLLLVDIGENISSTYFGPIGIAIMDIFKSIIKRNDNEDYEALIGQKIINEVIPQALNQASVQVDNFFQKACRQMEAVMQQRLQLEQEYYHQKHQEIESELREKQQEKNHHQQCCQSALQVLEQHALSSGLTMQAASEIKEIK